MYTIMIVEDDAGIREELGVLLQKNGYRCELVREFSSTVDQILKAKPHLVLLDLQLPFYDGYTVCRELRRQSDVPIIVVTSRDSELDELMSMNLGADDFVTKPYNTQILLARIASVLSRAWRADSASKLTHQGLTLDIAASTASAAGQTVELTKNELRILQLLMQGAGRIHTRSEIMEHLWQSDAFIDDNTLTVNINRLRKKLESIGVTGYLVTKRGQGYLV